MSTPEHKFGKEISDELTAAGFTVIDMESLGNGVPDRIAFNDGKAFLFETKIEGNGLTKHQEVWIKTKYKNNLPYYVLTRKKSGAVNIKEIKTLNNKSYYFIHHGDFDIERFIKGELGL